MTHDATNPSRPSVAMTQNTRKDFETWATFFGHDITRRSTGRGGDDGYVDDFTLYAWTGWQAAFAFPVTHGDGLLRKAIADVVAESKTVAHVTALGHQADDAQRCLNAAQQKLEKALAARQTANALNSEHVRAQCNEWMSREYGIENMTEREASIARSSWEAALAAASSRPVEKSHATHPGESYQNALREVANALWLVRRKEEESCDMELDDICSNHPVWDQARAVLTALSAREPIGYAKPEDVVPDGYGHVFRVYQSSVPFSATVPIYASLPLPPDEQE